MSQRMTIFEQIRHTDEDGNEYWRAREMAKALGYRDYEKFPNVITKAETACEQSGQSIEDHFRHVADMIAVGKGAQREVEDVHLSRYACYLIVQNADPHKPSVARGQTYFAVRTRHSELTEEQAEELTEDQLRLQLRQQVKEGNTELTAAAYDAGIVTSRAFALFQDHGYRGLYGGERRRDIAARKAVPQERILDYMGSEELAANWFRITQTKAKLERERIIEPDRANAAHEEVGRVVREAIKDIGGDMPETLVTPKKSIQELERDEHRCMTKGMDLFPEVDNDE